MERREYKNLGPRLSAQSIIERTHQRQPHSAVEIFFFVLLLLLAAAVILAGIFRWVV
jgi:hypothetical protein